MTSKFDNSEFRQAFVAANVKRGIAYQIRAMRDAKEMNQTQFGELIGKPQSVICRLENPNYGKVSVQTLIEIANDLDVGLLVKFVPHTRVLGEVERLSREELAPLPYMEAKAKAERMRDGEFQSEGKIFTTKLRGGFAAGSSRTVTHAKKLASTKLELNALS